MTRPKRHDNHILETESNKYFKNCIPNEWFVDKPEHDYGIDFIVNLVLRGYVTGLNFSVQLKSMKVNRNEDFACVTLKHSTLGMFNTRLEPVLIIAYVKEDEEAYWCWYADLKIDLTSSQKSYRIRVPKSNKLSEIDTKGIFSYVQNVFGIKTFIEDIGQLEYTQMSDFEILAWKNYFSCKYEDAAFYLRKLLKSNNNSTIYLEALSYSLYQLFNYQEALYYINKAIAISETPNNKLIKACILAEDGLQNNIKSKLIQAKELFAQFISEFPNQDMYNYNYANTLNGLEESKKALEYYEKCLKINPNHSQAWKNLGSVYYKLEAHEKELECYDKALAINPNLSQALFSKGVTLSHIYQKHEEALPLMLKSIELEEFTFRNYSIGYYWLAYVYEKLSDLKSAFKFINDGLEQYPENTFLLKFKAYLSNSYWKDHVWIKEEAIKFFEYRLSVKANFENLYYLIIIREINDEETILNLIAEYIPLFKTLTTENLNKCKIKIFDHISFLRHYNQYMDFRHQFPLSRYTDHLVSDFYIISSEFWDILDLVFATSYSAALLEYRNGMTSEYIAEKILSRLLYAPNSIFELIPSKDFSKDESISIVSHNYIEFPNIIIREFGAQVGYITGVLGLNKPNSAEHLPEKWVDALREKIFINLNEKLKLIEKEK
ncbi:DUF4365 domain-containing protein [Muricauda oceani]|uniref:DUF4365 domain-containing protein n=1 Tax=Flagellimonas oceani TaxID=2698672 RepID=A0A6G7J2G1_9FLAO|nr:DUF4365 domain-containing protein [Allomuricauda oceani]MBW8244018.1 DUF4365 domain-containing protein [Allomuricauda oceani]QII44995.1 DUF4365 domain-containing protein [Allomuricauda oceani]